jgi:2,3-bisphosphoglycerate-dependent phosphoglycerate mutase
MRLYFIRHGQSQNNALYARTGSDRDRVDDPKLTDIGLRQAEITADFISSFGDPVDVGKNGSGFHLTHIYSSLMHRSIFTGTIIARKAGLPLMSWLDWHENGGVYFQDPSTGELCLRPGMTRSELLSEFPDLIIEPSVDENGWWNQPQESEDNRPIRARRVLQDLLQRHGGSDDRVAVVSHGGFFNQFLAAVIGLEKIQPVWFHISNCAITRFDFREGEQAVIYHNHVAHLPKDLIT